MGEEGQVLRVLPDFEAASHRSTVSFVIDEELTRQRQEDMADRRYQIPRAPKGDFRLCGTAWICSGEKLGTFGTA